MTVHDHCSFFLGIISLLDIVTDVGLKPTKPQTKLDTNSSAWAIRTNRLLEWNTTAHEGQGCISAEPPGVSSIFHGLRLLDPKCC
jgi:hypothetical protein